MNDKTIGGKIRSWLIFAAPATFIFFAVIIVPLVYGVYLTFTNWDGISSQKKLVGFLNYITVFHDAAFWSSLGLTIAYVAISVLFINIIGFFLAYLLSGGVKGQTFMRAGFFTPNLIGGIVLGFIWRFIFDQILVAVGKAAESGLFSTSWLSDPSKAFWAMIIVTVWQYSGYMMIIYIAGLTSISQDIKEAASIDGCNGLKQLRFITLPLMASSFTICLFLSISRTFMVYDLNLSFTKGGPYGSTIMSSMYVYRMAFTSKNFGVGQSEAFVLFLVVVIITLTQTLLGKRKEVEA